MYVLFTSYYWHTRFSTNQWKFSAYLSVAQILDVVSKSEMEKDEMKWGKMCHADHRPLIHMQKEINK